jgi:hypothetical protein
MWSGITLGVHGSKWPTPCSSWGLKIVSPKKNKKLTPAKLKEMKEKGSCFKCNDKHGLAETLLQKVVHD